MVIPLPTVIFSEIPSMQYAIETFITVTAVSQRFTISNSNIIFEKVEMNLVVTYEKVMESN
jgi:hypothetical protein